MLRKIFYLILILIFTKNSYSQDMATWGITGIKCKETLNLVEKNGQRGFYGLADGIQGFLTGYNTSVILNFLKGNKEAKPKIINHLPREKVTNLILSLCKAQPDEKTYIIIQRYYDSLPIGKY